jgi:hypothetical protein
MAAVVLAFGERFAECRTGGDVALPLLVDFRKTFKKGVRDVQGSSDSFGGTVRIAADNADRVKRFAEHLQQFFHEDGGGECLESYLVGSIPLEVFFLRLKGL